MSRKAEKETPLPPTAAGPAAAVHRLGGDLTGCDRTVTAAGESSAALRPSTPGVLQSDRKTSWSEASGTGGDRSRTMARKEPKEPPTPKTPPPAPAPTPWRFSDWAAI
jgi:hypothetical protein